MFYIGQTVKFKTGCPGVMCRNCQSKRYESIGGDWVIGKITRILGNYVRVNDFCKIPNDLAIPYDDKFEKRKARLCSI